MYVNWEVSVLQENRKWQLADNFHFVWNLLGWGENTTSSLIITCFQLFFIPVDQFRVWLVPWDINLPELRLTTLLNEKVNGLNWHERKRKNSDRDHSCMHRFLIKHVSGSKLMQAPGFKWSMCQLQRKMFPPVMKGVAYYNKMCVGIQIKHVLG